MADVNYAAVYAGAVAADEAADQEAAASEPPSASGSKPEASAPVTGLSAAGQHSLPVASPSTQHTHPQTLKDDTPQPSDHKTATAASPPLQSSTAEAPCELASVPPAVPFGYLSAADMLLTSRWAAWLEAHRLGLRQPLGEDERGRRYWALGGRGGAWCIFVEWDEGREWGW